MHRITGGMRTLEVLLHSYKAYSKYLGGGQLWGIRQDGIYNL